MLIAVVAAAERPLSFPWESPERPRGWRAARNAAKGTIARGAYTAAQKAATYTKLSGASGELGAIGLREYITGRFGAEGPRLYSGMPTSGGAARGVSDELVEIVVRDTAGNPVGARLFIGEAKGAAEAYSIVGRAPGRLVTLQDGREVYALQGTKEYVEGVALEMAGNTANPAVQAAGLKVLAKIQSNAWDEIEYAFVVSRWVTRGNRVAGMSPIVQVTRVALR